MKKNPRFQTSKNSRPPRFDGSQRREKPAQPQFSAERPDSVPREWRAIIGNHAIREALAVNSKGIELLWIRQGFESAQDLKDLHSEFKSKIKKIEVKPLSSFERFGTHQGAVLFLSTQPELDVESLQNKDLSRVLILDGIEDPHNLGAILRSGWLMGVDAVYIPADRAVGLTPIVHKVASGGVEHVPVVVTANFSQVVEKLKEMGYWVFGLSHEGKGSIFDLKIPEKVAWCVGSEDKGLRKTTEKLCDELVRIPQISAAASYNASVATAIALTETFRQQTHPQTHTKKSSN